MESEPKSGGGKSSCAKTTVVSRGAISPKGAGSGSVATPGGASILSGEDANKGADVSIANGVESEAQHAGKASENDSDGARWQHETATESRFSGAHCSRFSD